MGKDEAVTIEVLGKICDALDCEMDKIVEFIMILRFPPSLRNMQIPTIKAIPMFLLKIKTKLLPR